MRRFAAYFLTSFFLFGFGASLWFGYRVLFTGTQKGSVLGATTQELPFWRGATLLLTGENQTTLAVWSEGSAPRVLPSTQQLAVVQAKASPDGSTLLVVTDGGTGVQVFRLMRDTVTPAPLVAVTGAVSDIQFSPNGQYVLFQLSRINPTNRESDVLDISTGTIRRIANDADGAMWDANGDGVFSWTATGVLRLHTMSLDGAFREQIEIRGSLVGNPVVLPKGTLVFIVRTSDAFAVMTHDLVTKEERLITPIALPPETTSARLIPAPGGEHILFRSMQKDAASPWVILDASNGTTKPAAVVAASLVWEDTRRFFFQGTDGMLRRYDIATNTLQAFPTVTATVLP